MQSKLQPLLFLMASDYILVGQLSTDNNKSKSKIGFYEKGTIFIASLYNNYYP